jgi:hypothetical protein
MQSMLSTEYMQIYMRCTTQPRQLREFQQVHGGRDGQPVWALMCQFVTRNYGEKR